MNPAFSPSRKAAASPTSSDVAKRLAAHTSRTCSNQSLRGPDSSSRASGGGRERVLDLALVGAFPVPGDARDHDAGSTRRDDPGEGVEDVGGPGEVYLHDPLDARLGR